MAFTIDAACTIVMPIIVAPGEPENNNRLPDIGVGACGETLQSPKRSVELDNRFGIRAGIIADLRCSAKIYLKSKK